MAIALQTVQEQTGARVAVFGSSSAVLASVACLGLLVLFPLPHWLVREYGPVELAQAGAWWVSAAVALFSAGLGRHGLRGRALLGWLGVLSVLAFAREFDMHESLNPEVLGDWGVRYRADWWLDAATPVAVKLLWASAALFLVVGVFMPLLIARPHPLRQLLVGHPATVVLGLAVAAMAMGYVMDDLLGRDQFIPWTMTEGIEESFELIGAVLWFAGILLAVRSPMLVIHRRREA
ncbi:MAG: hypothetical protein AAGB51_09970 [Planctomycetota bacterium]